MNVAQQILGRINEQALACILQRSLSALAWQVFCATSTEEASFPDWYLELPRAERIPTLFQRVAAGGLPALAFIDQLAPTAGPEGQLWADARTALAETACASLETVLTPEVGG